MKLTWIALLTALCTGLFGGKILAQEPDSQNSSSGWMVEKRKLPLPVDASSVLIESLAAIAKPDVNASNQKGPKSDKEWESSVEAIDQYIGQITAELIERRNVAVSEDKIEGVKVHWLTPAVIDPANEDRLFLFTHGGAYTSGYGLSSLLEGVSIADAAKIRVLSIDYLMPPKHPFPVGLNEVITVYKHIIDKYDPATIGFGGTSAGGGLALASVHKMIELGLPTPGALFAGTPWSDLTKTGDSYYINEGVDRVLISFDGRLKAAAEIYAGDHDLRNPLISPVYGDFDGFPPTYLVSGTRDLFLSNTIRVHRKLKRSGVTADLNIYEGVSHGEFFVLPDMPEAIEIYTDLGLFLDEYLK